MEDLTYKTQKYETETTNSQDQLLTNLNKINPILIKCASLNSGDFYAKNNSSTSAVINTKILTEIEDTMQERKTKSDIKVTKSSIRLKLDNIDIDSQIIDDTETLEEKAFQYFRVAQQYYDENKYDEALQLYNNAITCYTISPLIYAKRAQTFLKLNKPMNCINDCSSALAIAPDHVLARKFRGRAYMLMGEWNKAMSDLVIIDDGDDDDVNEWMNKILPMVNKIDSMRNIQESEDDKFDNIEGGDNCILHEMDIDVEMQDPEVIEALNKSPKIKRLFKRMLKMLKREDYILDRKDGDAVFSYFSSKRKATINNNERNVDSITNFKNDITTSENDQWLQCLRNHAHFQNITEDEMDLYGRNISDESDATYSATKSSIILDDLSD